VLALGPRGKSFSLFGIKDQSCRGILPRTVEKILKITTGFIGQMDIRTFDKRQSSAIMASEVDF
jgi:hypothetical protein